MTNETSANHIPHVISVASGDWAWLGAKPGTAADNFYTASAEDWLGTINSRYVDEMLDDTLPDQILKSYLIQDFKFFNQDTFTNAVRLAPAQSIRDMLTKQIAFIDAEEAPYFTGFLKEYQVSDEEYDSTPQIPASKTYCDELSRLAASGSFPQLITAICCMEWIYLAWAKRTTDAGVRQQVPAHAGWVDLHEGEAFRQWTGNLIALVNKYANPDPDGPEGQVFRRIAHLERGFFEQSYDMARAIETDIAN